MPYGRGFGTGAGAGWGRGGGYDFGFRGSSPPWPYVGRGRGGLPRCGYYFAGSAYNWPSYGYVSPAHSATGLEELRNTISAIKDQLESMRSRVSRLDKK